jgi:hypothetical protein
MSKVIKKIEKDRDESDLKMSIIGAFVLCALCFFCVGVMYGASFNLSIVVPLLVFLTAINVGCARYIIRRINKQSK